MRKGKTKNGFTLIELALSIVFISVLSLTIVLIINNTIIAYRRGLTLNEINTTGMDLVNDIRTSVQSSPINAEGVDDVLKVYKYGDIELFGAFCNGYESYVWNSGYLLNDKKIPKDETMTDITNKKSDYGIYVDGYESDGINTLIKFPDKEKKACEESIWSSNKKVKIENINSDDVVKIIPNDIGLALYSFSTTNSVKGGGRVFYVVSFTLGSKNATIDYDSGKGYYCNDDVTYCAINNFKFAVQATGGSKSE